MSPFLNNAKYRLRLRTAVAAMAMSILPLAFAPAQAQSASSAQGEDRITGVVVNAAGDYLRGAEVRVEGSDIVSVTDNDGRFTLQRVPGSTQQLSIAYFGYETGHVAAEPGATDVRVALNAQTTDASSDIVVSGSRPIAESEEAALQLKRSSTSLVDVIAADSAGRFPDQNIAAAVSRLPGVSVGRDQGQERYISLRGAPASWTTLAFDGVNVISPAGRETRFDTIPSSIASQTIIRKAVTADMPGETVAGNINIVTRSPFDYPGLKGALDAGYGFNDLGQGKQYNLSGFLSDRFANDTLGVLVGASRYERDMVTDNFENDWEIASEDQEPGGQNRIWASKHQNKLYRLKRSNTSYSGRLEWRPDGDNKLFLSSIYSQFRDDELRNAWVFDLDQDAKKTGSSTVGKTTGYADIRNGNTPAQGTLYGAEIESTLNSNSSRQSIFTNTLAGEHELDSWKLRWRANYTRADDRSKPPFGSSWSSPSDFTKRPTLVYDFTDPNLPKVQLFNTVLNADGTYGAGASRPYISPTELNFLAMTRNRQLDRTNAYTAKLDVEHTLDLFGANTVFQFGGEYDKRIKTSTRVVQEVTPATLANAEIARPTQADISIDTPYKGKLPLGYGWKYFSSELGEALFDRYLAAGAVQVQANTSEQNNYRVSEEVIAGYAMGTTYFDWGNVVYGARIEHIRNVGSALSLIGDDWTPTRVSNGFTSVYPSIHVNWDINRDMKLRLSGNTGAARPNYDALRPNFSYSDVEQTVSGGNPRAKPERAKGVDLYFEWYMPSRGFFSVGGYYKDLRDILYDVELPAFGSDALNTTGVDRSAYRYATIANGGGGHIKGLEFAFSQPFEGLAHSMGLADWAQGFGIQANLTLNDSKATTPDGRTTDLPGASPLIYNVSGYYERYGFSARLSYQWQKAYLDSLGAGDIIGDAYWADVARLDASLRYSINEHVQLYVDANNLTNEPGIRYQGDYSRLIEHETFGRRYLAGVRINF